jgi:hypothetical protein
VLDRGVTRDEVEDHLQTSLVGGAHEFIEIGQRAQLRRDRRVVADVVAVVGVRRGVDRRQPDRRGAKAGNVLQPGRDPPQVSNAVAIGVLERAHIDLVHDGVLEPHRSVSLLVRGTQGAESPVERAGDPSQPAVVLVPLAVQMAADHDDGDGPGAGRLERRGGALGVGAGGPRVID